MKFYREKNYGKKIGDTEKYEIKSNRDFWFKKIERNIERDKEVNLQLKKEGWTVLRFWGKDILKNTNECVNKIEAELLKRIHKKDNI